MADAQEGVTEPDGAEAGGARVAQAARPIAEPILGQAEVDALAGYDDGGLPRAAGLRAMADGGLASQPAMPTLAVVLDRFARFATLALRPLFAADVAVSPKGVESCRYADFLDGLDLPSQLFTFRAEGWAGCGLLALDPDITLLALDRLLGGGGAASRSQPASRPATAIEIGILSQMVAVLLKEAERAFAPVAPVVLTSMGLETNPRASDVAHLNESTLVSRFEIDIGGQAGGFDLVLPASTLEPVRELLADGFAGEKLGRDDLWSHHLATEVWQADVEAAAVLHSVRLPLGRVLALAVGETLMLGVKPSDLVDLRCGDLLLTRGRMGRVDGHIALQVAEPLRRTRPDVAAGSHLVPRSGP